MFVWYQLVLIKAGTCHLPESGAHVGNAHLQHDDLPPKYTGLVGVELAWMEFIQKCHMSCRYKSHIVTVFLRYTVTLYTRCALIFLCMLRLVVLF